MRIGFDAKRAFFNFSGLGNYSRNTIRQICSAYPDHEYYLYIPGKNVRISNELLPNQTPVNPVSLPGRLFPSFWRSLWLGGCLERDRLDLYHGLSAELPSGIHRRNIRTVVTIHDLIFLRYPEWYKATDRWIYTRKSRYACVNADRIIAISQQTKKDIEEYFAIPEDKIDVVYQGCDPGFYRQADEEIREKARKYYKLPSRYLLYVGTVEPRKNLLQILKALHISGLEMPLVVIGRQTPYARSVRHYIAEMGLEHIHFLDQVPNHDLPVLYQLADIFIYPSLFEGFGIPILEALNSGTPVITTRGGCFSEAGGPGSLYIDPENPDEIAESIQKILDNPDLAGEMSRLGKRHAEGFRAPAVSIMDVYEKIL
jgi:glycosyltransferase involved in cell wall biosynthesis